MLKLVDLPITLALSVLIFAFREDSSFITGKLGAFLAQSFVRGGSCITGVDQKVTGSQDSG